MSKLDSMNSKFDEIKNDVKGLRDCYTTLQEEIKDVRKECAGLRQDNKELKEKNANLEKKVDDLEKKTDDLECRSKRNNVIIHGLQRPERETADDLEAAVGELFTDKLELAKDIPFDRLHRLNSKPTSPVIGCCTFFKDKLQILKAKGKLRGTGVFIGEDFSWRVREIRRKLTPHLKKAREENKRVSMIFDHLVIEGKKLSVDDVGNLKELK